MCTYLHKAPNGVYYFRMAIPAELRPSFGGKREIKHSLRTKDRDVAKRLIPDHTKAACRIPADVADAIQGHVPRHEGGKYASVPLSVLKEAIEKLPR